VLELYRTVRREHPETHRSPTLIAFKNIENPPKRISPRALSATDVNPVLSKPPKLRALRARARRVDAERVVVFLSATIECTHVATEPLAIAGHDRIRRRTAYPPRASAATAQVQRGNVV
jgi:hypothetical protein